MPERPQHELDRYRARSHALKQERDLQAQKAASSRPGQVYHTMTSLADRMSRPDYTNNQADINQLKSLRRDWNRNQKYTPQGMQVSGATTPMEAQDAYMGMSRDLRQGNKPAYNKMYPLTGGFMEFADKGGLWGSLLSGMAGKTKNKLVDVGRDIKNKIGIMANVDDTVDVQDKYVTETFGPHREDIEELDINEEYTGPWPHEDMPYLSDEAAAIQKEFNTNPYFQNLKDPNVVLPFEKDRRGHPHLETYTPDPSPRLGTPSPHDPTEEIRVEEWLTDPSLPMPDEGTIPAMPFDDSLREAGIAALYGKGANWGRTGRRYEDEYRDYVERSGNMPGGPMTYEEFSEAWEDIHQGKPHAGLR